MPVGLITDKALCTKISTSHNSNPIILWQGNTEEYLENLYFEQASDSKQILNSVLQILPNPDRLTDDQFRVSLIFQIDK